MELEIKVMWCKGLTSFNFFQKLTIYTLVSIKSEDQRIELTQEQKQEQKTPTDEQNDGNPEWNHTLLFNLRPLESISPNYENLSLVFEFRHQGQLFGDKIVGEVCVPVKSLIESNGINVVRFVSYEVRSPEGKHNGVLDFSYKVVQNHEHLGNNNSFVHSEICISGYDVRHNNQRLYWDRQNYNHVHQNQGEIIRHQHQHYELVQHSSSSEPERIEYPRIDLEDWSAGSSALVTNTGISHYPPAPAPAPAPGVVYPPPPGHQWGAGGHYPPQPPPPAVYPPPRYGDQHWGYYRPPNSNQQNGYPHW